MPHPSRRFGLVCAALLAMLLPTLSSPSTQAARPKGDIPRMKLGPGDAKVRNIKNKAVIRWSRYGFIYISGQHDNHLTITFDRPNNALIFTDTTTTSFKRYPLKRCTPLEAVEGVAITCAIPARFDSKKMFVQVWPRLGDDFIDGSRLPRRFRLWVLADGGDDILLGGKGNDFFNAAFDDDIVHGGRGNDWIRGGPGADELWGGLGRDRLSCAEQHDVAYFDDRDSFYQCEDRIREDEVLPLID